MNLVVVVPARVVIVSPTQHYLTHSGKASNRSSTAIKSFSCFLDEFQLRYDAILAMSVYRYMNDISLRLVELEGLGMYYHLVRP